MVGAQLGSRDRFPALSAIAYCNHAAISPPSRPVSAAARAVLTDYEQRGLGAFFSWMEQRERFRGALARFIDADAPDEIGFCANTTSAIRTVALCRPWKSGDRVILLRGEFPANVTPWLRAAELFNLEPVWLDASDFSAAAGGRGMAQLEEVLKQGAALLAVSAVQFSTGLTMPLAEMAAACHRHGAEICVDAIQACGATAMSVRDLDIDYLAAGSHKWLMGLEGAAFVWMRRRCGQVLRPHLAGWLSHEDPVRFLLEGAGHLRYDRPIRKQPDFVEGGATNAVGFAAWEASVALLAELGPTAIAAHIQAYHDALEPLLVDRGFVSLREPTPSGRSGILSLTAPEGVDVMALSVALMERGVSCSAPDGNLRFAPHWPNALGEVHAIASAVDDAVTSLRA